MLRAFHETSGRIPPRTTAANATGVASSKTSVVNVDVRSTATVVAPAIIGT